VTVPALREGTRRHVVARHPPRAPRALVEAIRDGGIFPERRAENLVRAAEILRRPVVESRSQRIGVPQVASSAVERNGRPGARARASLRTGPVPAARQIRLLLEHRCERRARRGYRTSALASTRSRISAVEEALRHEIDPASAKQARELLLQTCSAMKPGTWSGSKSTGRRRRCPDRNPAAGSRSSCRERPSGSEASHRMCRKRGAT
jgi:hypothetical protein